VAQVAPLLALLFITPFLIHHLGLDRYGLWSLVTTMVIFGTGLDGGLGATLLRWFGVERHNPDRDFVTRLSGSAVGAIVGGGVLLSGIAALVARPIAAALNEPVALRPDAAMLVRVTPVLIALPLIASVFNAHLQAQGRFRAVAVRALFAEGSFLLAVFLLVPRHGLAGVIIAALVQQTVSIVLAFAAASRHLDSRRLGILSATEAVSLARFAWRVQVGSLANLVMLESDALVVAAFLPIRYVGIYGVGAAAAGALRSLPLFAVPAIYSHLVADYVPTDPLATVSEAAEYQQKWSAGITGYTFVACACSYAAVTAWVGHSFGLAGLIAASLALGNSVNLGTAVMSTVCRVLGRPGPEMRYGLLSAIANLLMTVPLALLFGVYGILAATVVAQIGGSIWFMRVFRREIDPSFPSYLSGLPLASALLAAVAGGAGATALSFVVPTGVGGLALCGCVGAAAVSAHAAWLVHHRGWVSADESRLPSRQPKIAARVGATQ
jgi:O-antigen/teichoic acid export membrane protein